ncbi:MAG: hypothetical protein IJV76_05800 [Clostridia bacterium]|nr:hypothetical protein [Clostridia bacterium]
MTTIDRKSLVSRHNIELTGGSLVSPVGNGEFCFCADRTGLQTFGGNTMAHWAWHEFPLPEGVTADDLSETGSYMTGRLTGQGRDLVPEDKKAAARYMFDNPHSFSLSRLRFVNPDGSALDESILDTAGSVCDLWNGMITSTFTYNGTPVRVTTCVHPDRDAVAVKIETDAELAVMLDFGYPSIKNGPGMGTISKSNGWNADYDDPDPHYTSSLDTKITSVIARIVDETEYSAAWRWSNGTMTTPSMHERLLTFTGTPEFTVE